MLLETTAYPEDNRKKPLKIIPCGSYFILPKMWNKIMRVLGAEMITLNNIDHHFAEAAVSATVNLSGI